MNRIRIVIASTDGEVYETLTEREDGELYDSAGEPLLRLDDGPHWLGHELADLVPRARREWKR